MDKFLTFTIIGLSIGAIYAVIASGLVLTYTTTGIFNFSQGAIGMFCAFVYWQMHFQWGWPPLLAAAVVLLVIAPALGALIEIIVMRGIEDTSEITKLVVSMSLLVALIAAAQWIWPPGESRLFPKFFESTRFHFFSTYVTGQQLLTIVVALLVAVVLRFFLYGTRTGIAMRAAVDDRSLASLNGARPNRVSMLAWGMGCSLAAIGGILIAPNLQLDAPSLSLLIVNAYAAAIIGRLRSLPLTFLGAVILGLAEGYLSGYLSDNQYFAGLRLAAPAILLFLVLLVIPNPRLRGRRSTREYFPMPSWGGSLVFAAAVVFAGVVMATTLTSGDALTYGKLFSYAIMALSLVPLIGFSGQISLAPLAFGGIGAIVVAHHGQSGNPIALLYAFLAAAVIGAIIALPALRLSGIYLALETAAFAVALDRWIFNLPDFDLGPLHVSIFGTGSANVEPLRLFGYSFDSSGSLAILCACVFAALSLGVVAIRRSRFGRRLLAMKDSEAACATLGLNLVGTKLAIFALSAGIAGIGGALYGMQLRSINSQSFTFVLGLPIVMLAVVSGIGAVGGALNTGFSLQGFLPLLATIGPFFTKLASVLPGLAGIGLGRNPNGAVQDMREGFRPIVQYRPAAIATVIGIVVLYGLRLADVLDNGWFYALVALTPVATVIFATLRLRVPVFGEPEVPYEWRGMTVPWTEADRREMDRKLALSEVDLHGAA